MKEAVKAELTIYFNFFFFFSYLNKLNGFQVFESVSPLQLNSLLEYLEREPSFTILY